MGSGNLSVTGAQGRNRVHKPSLVFSINDRGSARNGIKGPRKGLLVGAKHATREGARDLWSTPTSVD